MVRITVENIDVFSVREGINLRAALRSEGVFLDGTCADEGRCGRCVVRVLAGEHGEPGPAERGLLGEAAERGVRLACRIHVRSDMTVLIDPERLIELDRSGRWKATWGSPLWRPESISPTYTGYGLAVDLGTTSIATALYDLAAARPMDIKSSLNPQAPWGEEIMSRLSAAQEPSVAVELQRIVWKVISDQVRGLCLRNGISQGSIVRVAVVGNTAMHHLALGLPTGNLMAPPYEPAGLEERILSPEDLPLAVRIDPAAEVVFPPPVGGFVGSDALAAVQCARATGSRRGALIDVGTNTELLVWDEDRIMAASAPAGPAFEGGHISHGMRAEEGAVYSLKITVDDVEFRTIGGASPRGLCGTGIVDLVAEMLRWGIIDGTGLMKKGSHPCLDDGGLLVDRDSGIRFEPRDVETVQKAKAAVRAALDLLAARVDLGPADLARIYLAGAFGGRLNVKSAVSIGLVTDLPEDRFVHGGNAAMVGASVILLSKEVQADAAGLAGRIEHLTIAGDPDFEERYLENLFFIETKGDG